MNYPITKQTTMTLIESLSVPRKELETKLRQSIAQYESVDGETKPYWKGVCHTYQSVLNDLYGKEWDSQMIEGVVL